MSLAHLPEISGSLQGIGGAEHMAGVGGWRDVAASGAQAPRRTILRAGSDPPGC